MSNWMSTVMGSTCFSVTLNAGSLLAVVSIVLKAERIVKKPVGSKMCQHLCIQMVDCSSYVYDDFHLSCQLTDIQDDPGKVELSNYMKSRERAFVETSMKCCKEARIFYTRRRLLQCTQRKSTSVESSRPIDDTHRAGWSRHRSQMKYTRLLIVPYMSLRNVTYKAREISIYNDTSAVYPHFNVIVTAVSYIPTLGEVIISSKKPSKIHRFVERSGSTSIVRRHTLAKAIIVDDDKQIIFLLEFSPQIRISRMTVSGKHYKMLPSHGLHISDIAADTKRSVVYIVYNRRAPVMVTYNGVYNGTFAREGTYHSLYLDSGKDALYFTNNRYIFRMSLESKKVVRVLKTSLAGRIFVTSNKIYNVPRYQKKVMYIFMKDHGKIVKRKIDTGLDVNPLYVIICPLP